MFTYVESDRSAKIKVIGVGGAGGNAINNMIAGNLQGVKFITANTDAQALDISHAETRIQLGTQITEGLGAGANPQVGRDAALENAEMIKELLSDSHMVFITAGFGGGTGTGAAPVIARLCKEMGILTVAVVTRPFSFEGRKRAKQADDGILELRKAADTVITIPNDRLRGLASKNAKMVDMFKKADEILLHSVKGITDLIMMPGLVNLDFADVKTTMSRAGMAINGHRYLQWRKPRPGSGRTGHLASVAGGHQYLRCQGRPDEHYVQQQSHHGGDDRSLRTDLQ